MFDLYDGELEDPAAILETPDLKPSASIFADSLSIEEARALYFDDDALREPPYRLYRLTGDDVRWYYCPETDRHYAGVSTVIGDTSPTSPGLIKWHQQKGEEAEDIREERAEYGTWLHIQLTQLLISRQYDFDTMEESLAMAARAGGLEPRALDWYDRARKDILSFAAFVQRHKIKPLAVEVCLKSEEGIAGAVDLVCEMHLGSGKTGNFIQKDSKSGGTPIIGIIDYKSGRKGFYPNHEKQLHMYLRLWRENFPDVQVDRLFNWRPTDWEVQPTWKLKDQTGSSYAAKIPYMIGQFFAGREIGPAPRLHVGGKLSLDGDLKECYSFRDVRERFIELRERQTSEAA